MCENTVCVCWGRVLEFEFVPVEGYLPAGWTKCLGWSRGYFMCRGQTLSWGWAAWQ